MKRLGFSIAAFLAFVFLPCPWHTRAQEQEFKTIPQAAKELAPRIAQELKAVQAERGGALTVGVFAFGNEEGRVTEENAFSAKALPGELTTQLRNYADRKFVILDPFELKNKVLAAKADTSKLKSSSFREASTQLKRLGLDAAIIGSVQQGADFFRFNVHADVLFDDGAPLQISTDVEEVTPPHATLFSNRFAVEIYVGNQIVPMYRQGEFDGQYLLNLDRATHYNKPFVIRIINRGMPPAGWMAPAESAERTRFFTTSVFVDGVNSIYEKTPDGSYHPSQAHPNNVTKWVIGRYGYRILPGYDSDTNPDRQQRVQGYGSALVDIPGFQLDGASAARFVFTDAGESLAHDVGLTKEVGVISLYFFAEVLDGDTRYFGPGVYGAVEGGVKLGDTIQHRVFGVNVRTHPEPVEVWQIYYRYRGEAGDVASRQDVVPIATAIRQVEARMREHGGPYDRPRNFGGRRGRFGSAPPR